MQQPSARQVKQVMQVKPVEQDTTLSGSGAQRIAKVTVSQVRECLLFQRLTKDWHETGTRLTGEWLFTVADI